MDTYVHWMLDKEHAHLRKVWNGRHVTWCGKVLIPPECCITEVTFRPVCPTCAAARDDAERLEELQATIDDAARRRTLVGIVRVRPYADHEAVVRVERIRVMGGRPAGGALYVPGPASLARLARAALTGIREGTYLITPLNSGLGYTLRLRPD